MVIDFSDLIRKKVTRKNLDLTFRMDNFVEEGESIEFAEPVKLEASLSLIGDIINFDGKLSTVLSLACSRCTEAFKYDLEIDIHEKFTSNKDNDNEDIIFIDSDMVDITEIIQNNISTSLPFKKLCSESCKGLCQHCGANLNFSTCKCENDDIDPRLAKFKDMFSTD